MTKTHELKILPEYFNAVVDGRKTFELRKNDRGFKVNDKLLLKEININSGKFTKREILVKVTYLLENCEKHGLKDGFCIMGIKMQSFWFKRWF